MELTGKALEINNLCTKHNIKIKGDLNLLNHNLTNMFEVEMDLNSAKKMGLNELEVISDKEYLKGRKPFYFLNE